MKNRVFYNSNTLVNLSNSILKHFGAETFHETIPEIDELLKGHDKVVVMLFDGMGQNIIRMHLKEKSFIRSNYVHTINSVFPPTTSAATTAFLSAKYPIETGWLAWAQYFKEYNRNIILFKNKDYNTGEAIEGENIGFKYFPYSSIFELIKSANKDVDVFDVKRYPIHQDGPKRLGDSYRKINRKLKDSKRCFMYYYFDSPDYEMHEKGIDSLTVHFYVKRIDRFVKKITKKNKDTLFITIADHGHVNVEYFDICDHEDLYSLLRTPMTLEKRNAGFFIKEGQEKLFEQLFDKYYGEYFTLLSHDEILEKQIYGVGKMGENVKDFIVDYIAISDTKYCLYASKELSYLGLHKGHHAGGTDEERLIDVSVFNK